MGDEVDRLTFTDADRVLFDERLRDETSLLRDWLATGPCDESSLRVGYELEAWLIDHAGRPVADNERFLARVASPQVVPELSRFNVEINGAPQTLRGGAFRRLRAGLEQTWALCEEAADGLGHDILAIGILPTLVAEDLGAAHFSGGNRYAALNQQVLASRGGRPIRIDIEGEQRLSFAHPNVLPEAATTSFQVHFQAPARAFARYYNAACLASAPLVAVAANSPFLFGRSLWDETRIPLFEQAVASGALPGEPPSRVCFGDDWLTGDASDLFRDNLRFHPLLPSPIDSRARQLANLRLHSGTIWRWNRPIAQIDAEGRLTLRVEQRVMPAGPSIVDMVANAALYVGLSHALATAPEPPENSLHFALAKANFHQACRHGLAAELRWTDGRRWPVRDLLAQRLLPLARAGLAALRIDEEDSERLMDVIGTRTASGRNGAHWQRTFVARHGADFGALVRTYRDRQRSGRAVHEWDC